MQSDIERHGRMRVITARGLQAVQHRLGWHLWLINIRPLVPTFNVSADHESRYRIKRLDLDEALAAAELEALQMRPEFVTAAFDRGDLCIGAFDGDALAAYTWRSTTIAPIAGDLWLRIDQKPQAYGYKSFVLPAYRGQRLNDSVGRFCDPLLCSMGITERIAYIDLHNLSSIRTTFRDPTTRRIGYAGYRQRKNGYTSFRTRGVRERLAFEVISLDRKT